MTTATTTTERGYKGISTPNTLSRVDPCEINPLFDRDYFGVKTSPANQYNRFNTLEIGVRFYCSSRSPNAALHCTRTRVAGGAPA